MEKIGFDMDNITLDEVYRRGRAMLEYQNIPDAEVDALYLMESVFGTDRTSLILHGDRQADSELCRRFFDCINERISGRPLQYIVGTWNFMGYDFFVGEGVLIPRDDTETTVICALELLKNYDSPKVIDLCSGSGAIAISIKKMMPNANVTALELSPDAIGYLKKNAERNSADITIVCGDVATDHKNYDDNEFDMIVSNPPYIVSNQIDTLQRELSFEPRMALDGGSDGLDFYRVITENWASKIKPGGYLVYENGEDEHEAIAKIMLANGFTDIRYDLDLQMFKRTTYGQAGMRLQAVRALTFL